MPFFLEFLSHYFITVILCLGMAIIIFSNKDLDKKYLTPMKECTFTILILTIVEYLEYYFGKVEIFPTFTPARLVFCALGYTLRPLVLLEVCQMFVKKKKTMLFLTLPEFFNLFVSFSCFFTGISYSFSSTNHFMRGPLGYTPHVVTFFYLIVLIYFTFSEFHQKDYISGALLLYLSLISVLAIVLESESQPKGDSYYVDFQGICTGAFAVGTFLYYVYIHVQITRRDVITGLLNRRCFFVDSRAKRKVSGIICLDMNDLKKINDEIGHNAGDKALAAIGEAISSSLVRGTAGYRVGGDEFAILFFNLNETAIKDVEAKLRAELKQITYTCAIGVAIRQPDEDVDVLIQRVDKLMYENKAETKAQPAKR